MASEPFLKAPMMRSHRFQWPILGLLTKTSLIGKGKYLVWDGNTLWAYETVKIAICSLEFFFFKSNFYDKNVDNIYKYT